MNFHPHPLSTLISHSIADAQNFAMKPSNSLMIDPHYLNNQTIYFVDVLPLFFLPRSPIYISYNRYAPQHR
jgi:hypothetical protein